VQLALVVYAILLQNPLKEKASKISNRGHSFTQQQEILEKFVEASNLSQALLPTGGTLCYCCLTKLNDNIDYCYAGRVKNTISEQSQHFDDTCA